MKFLFTKAGMLFLGLALLCSGCVYSAKRRVAREIPQVGREWQTNVTTQLALKEQVLDWPAALALMKANNLKLRQTRVAVTNSEENLRQVFMDLVPTLDLHASASHTLANLSAISFDDVTFNIDSFFNFPGLASFSTRLFAARLTLMRARTINQLAEREQMIELYKLFLDALDAQDVAEDLQMDEGLVEKIRPLDEMGARTLQEEIKTRKIALEKQRLSVQDKAADVLGSRDKLWAFSTNGWPVFHYERDPLPLSETNLVAHLPIRLLAIELVGAWAQIVGMKLQYWPEVSLFISGPSLYQNVGGNSEFWDINQVRGTVDMFWRLDTRGNLRRQIRQTKRQQELEIARLRQEQQSLIAKLLAGQKLEASLREQMEVVEQLVPALAQLPPPQQLSALMNSREVYQSLRDQQHKLRRELAEVNTVFWFVDDRKWPAVQ
jgi:outer membrane protein TolC